MSRLNLKWRPVHLSWLAGFVLAAVLVWFCYEASRFVVVWLLEYPLLTALLAVFVLISWGLVGGGLGLNDLYWQPRPWYLPLLIGFGTAAALERFLHIRYLVVPAEVAPDWWQKWVTAHVPSLLLEGPGAKPTMLAYGRYMFGLYLPMVLAVMAPAVLDIRRRWLMPIGAALAVGLMATFPALLDRMGALDWLNRQNVVADYLFRVGDPDPVTSWLTGEESKALAARTVLDPDDRLPYTLLLFTTVPFVGFCLLFVGWEWKPNAGTPRPVLPLIALLGLFATVYALVATREPGLQYLFWFAVLGWGWWANRDPYKLQVPNLDRQWYAPGCGADLNPKAPPPPGGLLQSADVLKAAVTRWQEQTGQAADAPPLPPVVLLAVSGGGGRSAVWTCAVLEELHRLAPRLAAHVRIITGASGGMVGAAYHTAHLAFGNGQPAAGVQAQLPCSHRGRPITLHAPLARALSRDHLSPVVSSMLLRDIPVIFWPGRVERDRGVALELAWARNTTPTQGRPDLSPFARPLSTFTGHEADARVPSLVFSPMLVEDARRLLISNLDLAPLCTVATPNGVLSRPSVEFYKLFRDADTRSAFQVGTAARLQASFPFVSPALFLPTDPPRRMVDAGYYDNYGVDLAAEWLFHHAGEVAAAASSVLLLEVRGYANRRARRDARRSPDGGAVGWLVSPLTAVLAMRERSPWYRNDERVRGLDDMFRHAHGRPAGFVRAEAVEFPDLPGAAPLGWSMTDDQRVQLVHAAQVVVSLLVQRLRATGYPWV